MKRIFLIITLGSIFLVQCKPKNEVVKLEKTIPPIEITATPTIQPTLTITPSPTNTPIPYSGVCSPLDQITFAELPGLVSQPLKTPRPGYEDGNLGAHHGTDFSYWSHGDDINGMEGLPVRAVLDGTVTTILNDRYPYGNAILIETPLEMIDPAILARLQIPEIAPTVVPDNRNICPALDQPPTWDENKRSLYFIYAHLRTAPSFSVGDQVICDQKIGEVGNTGNSVNPHLHLELRIGPSDLVLSSMAKYDTRATEQEIYNYCLWRLSNQFQLIDPMQLLFIMID